MAKKLAEAFNLLNHTIYTEYLDYNERIPEKYRVKDRENLRRMIKTICKHIGREVVECRGGVHVRRLGYFFIWKIPRKMTYTTQVRGGNLKENFNYHSEHYMYSPIFLPSLDNKNTLKDWSMDNAFSASIKQGVKRKIKSGFNYKIYPFSITKFNRK